MGLSVVENGEMGLSGSSRCAISETDSGDSATEEGIGMRLVGGLGWVGEGEGVR